MPNACPTVWKAEGKGNIDKKRGCMSIDKGFVVKLLHHHQNNEIRKYFSVCVHRKERAPVNKIPLSEILNQSKSILYKLQLIWIALVHTVHYLPAIYVIAA